VNVSFDPEEGLIIVPVELSGPSGKALLRLALDTGATNTVVNVGALVALGYDPASSPERLQITTGSSVEFVPQLKLEKIIALGHERADFPVFCHTLPPSAGVDGLLGLDFLQEKTLIIDFRKGEVALD
jgi:predicted aspartyl protease